MAVIRYSTYLAVCWCVQWSVRTYAIADQSVLGNVVLGALLEDTVYVCKDDSSTRVELLLPYVHCNRSSLWDVVNMGTHVPLHV